MDAKRRWLVISYFSGVDALACSHHLDDRLEQLRMLGVESIVLSSVASPVTTQYEKLRVFSPAPSGLRYEMRYLLRRKSCSRLVRKLVQAPLALALLPGYAVEKLVVGLDSTWSWWITASGAAIRAAREHGCELIYSTGGPASAHLAAYRCARASGLPWVAEYQDPIGGEHIPGPAREKRFHAWLERLVARRADAVVFVTKTALDHAAHRTDFAGRGHFIYPGAEPSMFSHVHVEGRTPGALLMGHFGSLGGDRSAAPILKALRALVDEHPDARDNVRLLLMGDMDAGQRAMVERFEYPEMLDVCGKRARDESLAAMLRCDVLVLIQNASEHSAVSIPSKLYEYLHAGRRILGLTCANPELNEILVGLGHVAVDLRERHGVARAVTDLYQAHIEGGEAPASPSPFTTESAARQLVALADELRTPDLG